MNSHIERFCREELFDGGDLREIMRDTFLFGFVVDFGEDGVRGEFA